MNTEEVIQTLGFPEELANALVAAGTSILDATPEMAKNASNDLDMYNWYRDDEPYDAPAWMTAIMDSDGETPLPIFDIVQHQADRILDVGPWQASKSDFRTDDPLLVAFLDWVGTLDRLTEDLAPVHHIGNGVLMGVLAVLSAEYTFQVVQPTWKPNEMPEDEIELPTFRAVFRGGKLEHQYLVVIQPDLYISRTYTTTGLVKH